MDEQHRKDVVTRYRRNRRQERWSTVRLVLLVSFIVAGSIWWMARNLRS